MRISLTIAPPFPLEIDVRTPKTGQHNVAGRWCHRNGVRHETANLPCWNPFISISILTAQIQGPKIRAAFEAKKQALSQVLDMQQAKISLTDDQVEFVNQYALLGYRDKSSLVREALDRLRREVRQGRLRESADLYAEAYAGDEDLQQLTGQAMEGWPE